jgi:hypothetical protein
VKPGTTGLSGIWHTEGNDMVTANKPQNDRYVNRRTRAVIGLRHMGIRDMTVYARAMGMWVGRRGTSDPDCSAASKCVADVLASDNPIVKSLLQSGLPLKKSAKLGGYCQVRCPLCGATVSHVPCYTCAVRDSVKAGSAERKRLAVSWDGRWNGRMARRLDRGWRATSTAGAPTDQRARHSQARSQVMAERFEAGEDIHHRQDVKAFYEHGNGSADMFPSVFAAGFSAYREEPAASG